jgi:hypothetical protein
MTPEQMAMFQTRSMPDPAAAAAGSVEMAHSVESEGVDVVNEGLSRTMQYMAQNGPVRPIQRRRANVMTKQQLEEQKMNEAAGLPSNLEEAGRVVALESQVSQINDNINKLTGVMTQLIQSQRYAPPLTPPVKPVAEPLDSSAPNGTLAAVLNPPTPQPPVPPTVQTTLDPQTHVYVPDSSPKETLPPVSQETAPPTPSMSMGPIGTAAPLIEEPDSSPGLEQFELVEEETSPVDPIETKRLERQQILTDQVTNWLSQKDPHKFWRQFVAGACNKNLSYNTWPEEMKSSFDERFLATIKDPQILATICGRITKMQNGHLVAPHVAGAFVTVMVGFLSFALMEV